MKTQSQSTITSTETSEKAAPRRLSLRELVARAEQAQTEGQAAAETAVEGSLLDPRSIAALKEDSRFHSDTREALAELEDAFKKVQTNPYARRNWLRAKIEGLEQDDSIDPNEFLALMFKASACKLPGKSESACPLFVTRDFREPTISSTRLYLPLASRDISGKIRTNDIRMFVPMTSEDEPALRAILRVRPLAVESLIARLEMETLAHLRDVLWLGLNLLERASIYESSKIEHYFEQANDEGVLRRLKNQRLFLSTKISDQEVFVVEDCDRARRFIKRFNELSGYAKDFWKGNVNTHGEIQAAILSEPDSFISPQDFLNGKPGQVAVRHNQWKVRRDSDRTIQILLILERRVCDSRWRWVTCNVDGVRQFFGGERLSYHDWTDRDIPSALRACLYQGKEMRI